MCVFCERIKNGDLIYENDYVVAFFDAYPVTDQHLLIVTKRHVSSYFDSTLAERKSIDEALFFLKNNVFDKNIHDFNIGVNIGSAAGQSIDHCHIHLIPRRQGDMENPRGGVRGVIPSKQNYGR